MNRQALTVSGILVALGSVSESQAEYTVAAHVHVSTSGRYAYGLLGSARNSSDGTQYIGCFVSRSAGATSNGTCGARNASGTHVSCSTRDPDLLAQIRAMNRGERVGFYYDSSSECTTITLSRNGISAPK